MAIYMYIAILVLKSNINAPKRRQMHIQSPQFLSEFWLSCCVDLKKNIHEKKLKYFLIAGSNLLYNVYDAANLTSFSKNYTIKRTVSWRSPGAIVNAFIAVYFGCKLPKQIFFTNKSVQNNFSLSFRENWTVITFQFTQHNSVLEIKQSGTKGRLQSTVTRVMDTCAYRIKTSQSCLSSVIHHAIYGYRKVKYKPKTSYKILLSMIHA